MIRNRDAGYISCPGSRLTWFFLLGFFWIFGLDDSGFLCELLLNVFWSSGSTCRRRTVGGTIDADGAWVPESVDPSVSLFSFLELPFSEIFEDSCSAFERRFRVVVHTDRCVVISFDPCETSEHFFAVFNLLESIELELDNVFFCLLRLEEACS